MNHRFSYYSLLWLSTRNILIFHYFTFDPALVNSMLCSLQLLKFYHIFLWLISLCSTVFLSIEMLSMILVFVNLCKFYLFNCALMYLCIIYPEECYIHSKMCIHILRMKTCINPLAPALLCPQVSMSFCVLTYTYYNGSIQRGDWCVEISPYYYIIILYYVILY